MATCRICSQTGAEERGGYDAAGMMAVSVECPRCGRWTAAVDLVLPDLGRPDNALLMPSLAAYIRKANAAGERAVALTPENWREFAGAHARTPVTRKLDLLLRWYEDQSPYAGTYVTLVADLYPLVDAQNQNEVSFLRDTLVAQGLIEVRHSKATDCRITAKGWEHLNPPAAGGIRGTCFVAMSFDSSLDDAFNRGIRPALQDDCGFVANRVDRVPHNDNITNRIIAGIRSCQFIVADFTLQRQGVYYEAGFAEGLGRVVVRTCRADDFDKLHFDTRQFLHLKWHTPDDLRIQLADQVRGTIGTFGSKAGSK